MKCIVLAGGIGERLWPLSRKSLPKQFIELQKNHSVFQETIARNIPYCDEFIIVTNYEYREIILNQMEAFQGVPYRCIFEEEPRNTAVAITLACLDLQPSEYVFVVASDHLINTADCQGVNYKDSILKAKKYARNGRIVLFGKETNEINERFGYCTDAGFYEKPDRTVIKQIGSERVLQNLGIFLFQNGTFLNEFKKLQPKLWELCNCAHNKYCVMSSGVLYKSDTQSTLPSVSIEKAIVEKLKLSYHTDWFKEDAESYPIRVFLMKDEVTVALDTTGDSLHKRGYRKLESKAPIAENLAAALIMLTPWNGSRILVDPFCGSGTIPIEAAMMAANIAPGMNRSFTAESWTHLITPQNWKDVREEAQEEIITDIDVDIQGYDLDPEMVEIARINARKAGVENMIHFQARDIADLSHRKKYGFIITNPPYGERIGDKDILPQLYKTIGERYKSLDAWSMYLITGYEQAEKFIGKKADKNRKIYNGMIKTYFYQFMGPKPPRRSE